MTTGATILGMLPIALGFGAGAELRAPMAISIIGGLVTSTLLSLIVVPVAYTLADDLSGRSKRSAPRPSAPGVRRTMPVARRPL
jgi:Cu/Ag efflux pump CusA